MVLALFGACAADPLPPPGSLRMLQAAERGGEQDDGLGALVVGQAMCGSHVFLRSEGGTHALLGGPRVTQSCAALSGTGDLRSFEVEVYPTHTAAYMHAQLLLDPSRCSTVSDACRTPCAGVEVPADPEPPNADGTCPSTWLPLDQSTLLVGADTAAASTGAGSTGSTDAGGGTGSTSATDGPGSTGQTNTTTGTTTDGSTT